MIVGIATKVMRVVNEDAGQVTYRGPSGPPSSAQTLSGEPDEVQLERPVNRITTTKPVTTGYI
jgi:hypothetical protein